MPIYLFWGEDDFAIAKAVEKLRQSVLDPDWSEFNYEKLPGDQPDATIQALNQAMTPAFGMGERLVWLADTTICHHCPEALLSELKRTLPAIPETSHLLLTCPNKPDARLKSTKLVQQHAKVQEFSLIPPWKTDLLLKKVEQLAQEIGVKLAPDAIQALADAVGNDTRQLWNELEKLSLYCQTNPLDVQAIATLVSANNQNSLQLAAAIRNGERGKALGLVADLINRNEPALKIVATLVGQFRTWAIVKLAIEAGEKDEKAIATAAEIGNPKRIYFLRQEVYYLSSQQLLATLPILLELELSLKRGTEPMSALQTKIIELCHLFNNSSI